VMVPSDVACRKGRESSFFKKKKGSGGQGFFLNGADLAGLAQKKAAGKSPQRLDHSTVLAILLQKKKKPKENPTQGHHVRPQRHERGRQLSPARRGKHLGPVRGKDEVGETGEKTWDRSAPANNVRRAVSIFGRYEDTLGDLPEQGKRVRDGQTGSPAPRRKKRRKGGKMGSPSIHTMFTKPATPGYLEAGCGKKRHRPGYAGALFLLEGGLGKKGGKAVVTSASIGQPFQTIGTRQRREKTQHHLQEVKSKKSKPTGHTDSHVISRKTG